MRHFRIGRKWVLDRARLGLGVTGAGDRLDALRLALHGVRADQLAGNQQDAVFRAALGPGLGLDWHLQAVAEHLEAGHRPVVNVPRQAFKPPPQHIVCGVDLCDGDSGLCFTVARIDGGVITILDSGTVANPTPTARAALRRRGIVMDDPLKPGEPRELRGERVAAAVDEWGKKSIIIIDDPQEPPGEPPSKEGLREWMEKWTERTKMNDTSVVVPSWPELTEAIRAIDVGPPCRPDAEQEAIDRAAGLKQTGPVSLFKRGGGPPVGRGEATVRVPRSWIAPSADGAEHVGLRRQARDDAMKALAPVPPGVRAQAARPLAATSSRPIPWPSWVDLILTHEPGRTFCEPRWRGFAAQLQQQPPREQCGHCNGAGRWRPIAAGRSYGLRECGFCGGTGLVDAPERREGDEDDE